MHATLSNQESNEFGHTMYVRSSPINDTSHHSNAMLNELGNVCTILRRSKKVSGTKLCTTSWNVGSLMIFFEVGGCDEK